jgi:hypothetical protein
MRTAIVRAHPSEENVVVAVVGVVDAEMKGRGMKGPGGVERMKRAGRL